MTPDFAVTGKYFAPPGHNRYTDVLITVKVALNVGESFAFDSSGVAIDPLSAQHIRDVFEQQVSRELLRDRGIAIRLITIQPGIDWLVPIGCGRAAEIIAAKINEELMASERN